MKKTWIGFLVCVLILTVGMTVSADPRHHGNRDDWHDQGGYHDNRGYDNPGYSKHNYVNAEQARFVLQRTAEVLMDAQVSARKHGHYEGLAKAINEQQYARQEYYNGHYRDAIYFSLQARQIGENIIRANNYWHHRDYSWNDYEHYQYYNAPPPQNQTSIQIRTQVHDDHSAMWFNINLNF